MECMKMGIQQTFVKQYFKFVDESMSKVGKKKEWLKRFGEAETDFRRVCYLLRSLEASNTGKHGIEVLGMPSTREAVTKANVKSDENSRTLRELGNRSWKSGDAENALSLYTAALFHAASDELRALALGNRSCVLFRLICFEEAAADADRAIKLGFPESRVARLHIRIGQCHQQLHRLSEARKHFQMAITFLDQGEPMMRKALLPEAMHGLIECSEMMEALTLSLPPPQSVWKCSHNSPPKCSKSPAMKEKVPVSTHEGDFLLPSASNGIVRLRNTGHKRGWTLEVTRDVPVGEILIVEKSYASVLQSDNFCSHCFRCYRRCVNLAPCSGCPYVGFCSPSCAASATRRGDDGGGKADGLGRHVYDCGGLIPCLRLDNYGGWPKENKDSVGGPNVAHLSFACVANTPPACLLDYICSTGQYGEGREGGRGHQAFVGSKIRDTPPKVLDPLDYSAAAWLVAGSEDRSRADLWQRTVAAVFLAYCLSLGGYPMAWFDETEAFYAPPSPTNRPDRLPGSWVAACLLYHMQSVSLNAHSYVEEVFTSLTNLSSFSTREVASCLYPTLSLVNHSCNPSTFRVCSDGGVCFLCALSPLPAGTEVFDCYIDCFNLQPRANRQNELNSHYLFQCACEACSNDWPTLFGPQRGQTESLRCPQCSTIVQLPARRCPHCRSTRGMKSHELLCNGEVLKQMALVSNGVVPADAKDVIKLLTQLYSLVVPPSYALVSAQELLKMIVDFNWGIWSLEPWS